MFNPYPINEQPDGSYLFTSDYGIDYLITFEISSHTTVNDYRSTVYEFSFYACSTAKLPADSRVVDTVLLSLRQLFNDPFAVLLYVCESLDGRQLARKRTFDSWFGPYQDRFEKIDYAINAVGTMFYASVIIPINNPEKTNLLREFDQTYQLYVSYK